MRFPTARGHPALVPLEDLLLTYDIGRIHEKHVYVPDILDQESEGLGRVKPPEGPRPWTGVKPGDAGRQTGAPIVTFYQHSFSLARLMIIVRYDPLSETHSRDIHHTSDGTYPCLVFLARYGDQERE